MPKKVNIAVLFGGRSGEHEVSLMSAQSVLSVLDKDKYNIIEIGITHEGRWLTGEKVLEAFVKEKFTGLHEVIFKPEPGDHKLYTLKGQTLNQLTHVDVAFPVLHGTFGEDGTLQGYFELADIAYVGAGVLASSVGMDKALFKDVMRTREIPVVESIMVSRIDLENDMDSVIHHSETLCDYPIFVKPVNMGSSVGVSKCKNRSDLLEGLMDAARFDRRILIERGINGREIEVSVLGNYQPKASVAGEIIPSDDFYSYRAKYIDDSSDLIIPAKIPADTMHLVQDYAVQAFEAIDGAGMARIDFLLDRDSGEVYLNELNTIPGFTKISMYPKLWQASGIPYPELVDQLITLGIERKAERDRIERQYKR
jgi:D-alanine-D-alanine ligase